MSDQDPLTKTARLLLSAADTLAHAERVLAQHEPLTKPEEAEENE